MVLPNEGKSRPEISLLASLDQKSVCAVSLQNWEITDDGQELNVSELDEMYKDEAEDVELEGEEDEEAVEDPVPETKLDMGNISASMGVAELTLILCAGEDNEAKVEMQEILNQTMPVVQEHKRKWKEAGLDRILDTFDEKQIEQHVGQWMRRHNSVYLEGDAKYLYSYDHASISDPSDNESLHSIDTARYIRQSRRHVPTKISNTATIKMYRTHSHKRDELRAKYAYDDEQEHRHHMQSLLHRRREKERQLAYLAAAPQHCIHSSGHHPRRKHLRKRRPNSSLFDSSSSEEDLRSYGRSCDCRSCLRHHSVSRSASYQYCSYRGARDYHHHHHTVAASRTMHHLRRQHSYDLDLDLRPRMRENDCNCCNSDRLCSNVVHIANSSTEEWVVENCSSSSSPLVETPKKFRQQPKHQLVAIRKTNSKSVLSKCHKPRLQKILKTASASKLVKPKMGSKHLLGDTSDDEEDEVSPRRRFFAKPERKVQPEVAPAPAPASARKTSKQRTLTVPPSTFKQERVPPKHREGSMDPKMRPAVIDIVQTSDESEAEVLGRRRLVSFSEAKESKKASTPKTPSTRKPISWPTNRLSKIPEEVAKSKEPEGNPTEPDACSSKEALPKALETNSYKVLDEQRTNNKSAESDDSSLLKMELMKKSRGRPRKNSDSSEKITTSNPAKDKPRTYRKKTSSRSASNEKVATRSPDSQEAVAEKATRAKVPIPKSRKVKPTEPAFLDKATNSDDDLQRALALSKATYKDEELKRRVDPATPPPVNQSQSQSLPVFNNNSVACNSTAMANDTACARVLPPKKVGPKRSAAVSSTEKPPPPVEIVSLDSSEESVVRKGSDADCTVVTSTTICEPPAATAVDPQKSLPLKMDKRGILLHRSSSSVKGEANFTLTEDSLGEVIGKRFARKYLKYHMGSRTFDSSHSVYYRPAPKLADALRASSMDAQSLANLSSSSASDDDVFEQIQKYGDVYSVAEKN